MVTTITPVTFLAQEIHHSASCLASKQLVREVRKLPTPEHKKRLWETSSIGTIAMADAHQSEGRICKLRRRANPRTERVKFLSCRALRNGAYLRGAPLVIVELDRLVSEILSQSILSVAN